MEGKYFELEGLACSWKSTIMSYLVQELKYRGIPICTNRQPTNFPIGKMIRQDCLNEGQVTNPHVIAMLFAADRLQAAEKYVSPLLKDGYNVISDRGVGSSFAYQSVDTGAGAISEYNREYLKICNPNIIILDIDYETSIERLNRRGTALDKMESRGKEFFDRVRENYLGLAAICDNVVVINSMRPIEEVEKDVLTHILNTIGEIK